MKKRYAKRITAAVLAGVISLGMTGATVNADSLEAMGNPVTGDYDNAEDYIQSPFEAAAYGNEVIFKYEPHETYKIYCQDGFVTDLKFEAGETVNYIGAGDTTRWVIDRSSAGSGAVKVEHVYIKPIKRGLSTNIIINTNKRNYQINAISGGQYNPMVSWAVGNTDELLHKQVRAMELENMLTVNARNMHMDYKISDTGYAWSPAAVFDDGLKTYLKMKPEIASSSAPVFMVEEKGKSVLVNYRVAGGYYIIDRIFHKGNLMVGTTKVEIVNRND